MRKKVFTESPLSCRHEELTASEELGSDVPPPEEPGSDVPEVVPLDATALDESPSEEIDPPIPLVGPPANPSELGLPSLESPSPLSSESPEPWLLTLSDENELIASELKPSLEGLSVELRSVSGDVGEPSEEYRSDDVTSDDPRSDEAKSDETKTSELTGSEEARSDEASLDASELLRPKLAASELKADGSSGNE